MARGDYQSDNLRELVAEVAAAYFGRSPVDSAEVSGVISQIASSLEAIGLPASRTGESNREQDEVSACVRPASQLNPVQVRKSITPDALISFEDGKPYRTLRLHLASRGLTPEAYREKWGLPTDYPMVAPNYSAVRSQMAKSIGLGRHKTSSSDSLNASERASRRGRRAAGHAT